MCCGYCTAFSILNKYKKTAADAASVDTAEILIKCGASAGCRRRSHVESRARLGKKYRPGR
jgi:hypothetical protein